MTDVTRYRTGLEVAAAERRDRAIQLRLSGMSASEIAKKLRYPDLNTVYRDLGEAMQDKVRSQHEVEQLRQIELMRLDKLMQGRWRKAIEGDDVALGGVLRIMARRAKLLGLDAPTKSDVRVGPIDEVRRNEELEALLNRIIEAVGPYPNVQVAIFEAFQDTMQRRDPAIIPLPAAEVVSDRYD